MNSKLHSTLTLISYQKGNKKRKIIFYRMIVSTGGNKLGITIYKLSPVIKLNVTTVLLCTHPRGIIIIITIIIVVGVAILIGDEEKQREIVCTFSTIVIILLHYVACTETESLKFEEITPLRRNRYIYLRFSSFNLLIIRVCVSNRARFADMNPISETAMREVRWKCRGFEEAVILYFPLRKRI